MIKLSTSSSSATISFSSCGRAKVSPDIWTDIRLLVPKSMESIELVGGDRGARTIKITKFAQGGHFKFLKQEIDVLDTDNLYCKNTLIEGDVPSNKIESIVYESKFKASGDGGCVCKLTSEYHAKYGVELKEENIKETKDTKDAFGSPRL